MIRISFHGLTDVGLKRSNNEDMLAMEPSLGYWAVADGMGGEAAGEVASRIFIETAHEVFSRGVPDAMPKDLVGAVFGSANAKIISQAKEHREYDGMGCTAELITYHGEDYHLGHVGDSRTYIYRNGQLRQITRDHSFVQDQVDKGLITREEARTHAYKNLILRAVGVNEGFAIDFIKGRVLDGDLFLLCTDGLTDMVDDPVIQETLSLPRDLRSKVEKLVELAKLGGGKDNVTLVLCQVALS
jgi:protein phosphatase